MWQKGRSPEPYYLPSFIAFGQLPAILLPSAIIKPGYILTVSPWQPCELETEGLKEGMYKFKGKSIGKSLILWLGQRLHAVPHPWSLHLGTKLMIFVMPGAFNFLVFS